MTDQSLSMSSEPGRPIIVHVTSREGLSSAYLPQVARPMSLVRARGFDASLVVLAPVGELMRPDLRQRWRQRRREVDEQFGLPLTLLPSAPRRARGLWDDAVLLRLWLRAKTSGRVVLHCRGTEATHLALRARGRANDVAVVCDCRGVDGPEYQYYRGMAELADGTATDRAEFARREALQSSAIANADAVLCVSKAMQRHFSEAWGGATARLQVVPCCTDVAVAQRAAEQRLEMRAKLGLADKFVVSYVGSAAPWQALPQTLAVFSQIASIRPDAYLLVLTTDSIRLARAVEQAGCPTGQVKVLSVPHGDVPAYLAAADLGLLLREDSIVNRVASPMKFAEYLACGVPVVLSDGIGDFSDLVGQTGIGCVLPCGASNVDSYGTLPAFLSEYARAPADLRKRCHDAAIEHFSWPSAIDAVCQMYEVTVGPACDAASRRTTATGAGMGRAMTGSVS